MLAAGAKTAILTAPPENHAARSDHGFGVIGCEEGRRNQALLLELAGRIVLYATQVMRVPAGVRITGRQMHAAAGVAA